MRTTIRPYDPVSDADRFATFIAEAYNARSPLCDPEFVRWWFASSPFRILETPSDIWIAEVNDRIVGMNAQIASAIHIDSHIAPLAWAANTIVLPEFRRGLGVKILQECLNQYPNYGSISYAPQSDRILSHHGFQMFDRVQMPRAVRVADPAAFGALPGSGTAAHQQVAQSWARRVSRALRELGIDDLAAAAALWERVQPRYGLATVRSEAMLRWRLAEHPYRPYRFFAPADAPTDAFATVREDGSTSTGLRIVDLFGEEEAVAILVDGLTGLGERSGAAFVDFFATASPDREAFEARGYVWLEGNAAGDIPYLLSPLEIRTYNERLALRLIAPAAQVSYSNTFFTRIDGDRDRVTQTAHRPS